MASEEPNPSTVAHGKPVDGMCCMVSYEDITDEDKNYVEFQSAPSGKWKPCQFEMETVQQLVDTQFASYVKRVKTTDCQAELKRLLAAGPPVWVSDANGFPLDEGDTHVSTLWYASDDMERSARLKGSVIGEEREELLESFKEFVVVEGKEEGDDDDEEGKDEK
mmetsp:Transcript_21136/g.44045  ORF Transcript_21136/g.44045 Transcript_21136/m.44045 type:complete len:164 (+) Transcript_21136:171-662(+)